jgi:general secretion pathway protein C
MREMYEPVGRKTPNAARLRQQPTTRRTAMRMGILLLAGTCVIGFVWAYYFSGAQHAPHSVRPAPASDANRPAPERIAPALIIPVEQNPTATEPPSSLSTPPAATASDLKLKGTIVASGSTANQMIIEAPGSGEKVYVVGDRLTDGAEVAEIRPDHAVLRRDSRVEILRLARTSLMTMDDVSSVSDSAEIDLGAVRSAVQMHPEMVMSFLEAEPTVKDGRVIGYRVLPTIDVAVLELLGLVPGDILSAVNGIPLDGPDHGKEQLSSLSGAAAFTFSVWRENKPQVLTYSAAG